MSRPSAVLKPGVNGAPEMNEVIPLICQLSTTQPSGFAPSLAPRLGRSYM